MSVGVLAGCILAAVAGGVAETKGQTFLDVGSNILATLDAFAQRIRDGEAVDPLLAPGYSAAVIGLNTPLKQSERDGVSIFRFEAGERLLSQSEAAEEWKNYLASLATVDEASFDIQRLEQWWGNRWVGVVRLELLATLADGRRAVDRFVFRIVLTPETPAKIQSFEVLEGERSVGKTPHFLEVATAAGVGFRGYQSPRFAEEKLRFGVFPYSPAGIAVSDVDDDGFADLFIPDGIESKLFRNRRDGTFEDVTEAAGLGGLGGVQVATAVDFDEDGDRDFFLARSFEPDQLFENRGGVFHDVTASSGFDKGCCTMAAAWADYDLDGDLDLYVCRYLDPRQSSPEGFYATNGQPNQLYRNEGPGRAFTNVTKTAGVGDSRLCLAAAFGDYDNDRYPDIYIANDYGRNALLRNKGDGTFEDVTVKSHTLDYGAGMNATFGDYDNDGALDIYVTNIRSKYTWLAEAPMVWRFMLHSLLDGVWLQDFPNYFEILREWDGSFVSAFQQMASGNTLLRNRGDGTFEDRTWASGANPPGWYWGAVLADFDNDGWQDIYAANGWIYQSLGTEMEMDFLTSTVNEQDLFKQGALFDLRRLGGRSWHGYERNRYLRNRGDGTFEEIGWPTGADLIRNSRGVAVADFWNRGVLDIAVAAHRDHHALLRNEVGLQRNWLQVELRGKESNRDAVGAVVTVETGDNRQTREVSLGDGYASQSTLRQHFGLGEVEIVDRLTVFWPRTGKRTMFTDVPANRIIQITEGEQEWTSLPIAGAN